MTLRFLLQLKNIIRSKDVIGDVDTSILDSNEIQTLLSNRPKALERPVLIHNGQAVLGRPPELISQPFGTSIGLGEKNSALGWFSTHMARSFFGKIIG